MKGLVEGFGNKNFWNILNAFEKKEFFFGTNTDLKLGLSFVAPHQTIVLHPFSHLVP